MHPGAPFRQDGQMAPLRAEYGVSCSLLDLLMPWRTNAGGRCLTLKIFTCRVVCKHESPCPTWFLVSCRFTLWYTAVLLWP